MYRFFFIFWVMTCWISGFQQIGVAAEDIHFNFISVLYFLNTKNKLQNMIFKILIN